MVTLPSTAVPFLLRAIRANRAFATAEGARRRVRERELRPEPYGPPRRLRADVAVGVIRSHEWPMYSVTPRDGTPAGCVIYVHGGGWVNEIVSQHWALAAQIAAESNTTVLLPIYPLIPFGTAGEVVAGVVELVAESRKKFGAVCIAGDSAGGQIALSAALRLRDDHNIVLPRTLLISPGLDLTWGNPRIPEVQPSDPWLATPGGKVFAELWAGELDLLDPDVSPLAGDLTGLGPITLYTGTRDVLNPDAHLLVDKARAAGVDVDLRELVGQVHVYPLLPTREGREARALIVASLAGALASAP